MIVYLHLCALFCRSVAAVVVHAKFWHFFFRMFQSRYKGTHIIILYVCCPSVSCCISALVLCIVCEHGLGLFFCISCQSSLVPLAVVIFFLIRFTVGSVHDTAYSIHSIMLDAGPWVNLILVFLLLNSFFGLALILKFKIVLHTKSFFGMRLANCTWSCTLKCVHHARRSSCFVCSCTPAPFAYNLKIVCRI